MFSQRDGTRADRTRKFKTWDQVDWNNLLLPELTSELDSVSLSTDEDSFHPSFLPAQSSTRSTQHTRHTSMIHLDFVSPSSSSTTSSASSPIASSSPQSKTFDPFDSSTLQKEPIQVSLLQQPQLTAPASNSTARRHSSFLSGFNYRVEKKVPGAPSDGNEEDEYPQPQDAQESLPEMNVEDIPVSSRPKLRRSVTFAGDLPKMNVSLSQQNHTETFLDTVGPSSQHEHAENQVVDEEIDGFASRERKSNLRIDTMMTSDIAFNANSYVRKAFPKTIFDSVEASPSPRGHSRAMSESAAIFTNFTTGRFAKEYSNISEKSSAKSNNNEESSSQDGYCSTPASPLSSVGSQGSSSAGSFFGSEDSQMNDKSALQYQNQGYDNIYVPPNHHHQHHQMPGVYHPHMMGSGPAGYYGAGVDSAGVGMGGMMPPPPPLPSMPYATAEQMQAMQIMQQQMMMQWLQMQEQHQRLMMMQQQHQQQQFLGAQNLAGMSPIHPQVAFGGHSPTSAGSNASVNSPSMKNGASHGSRNGGKSRKNLSPLLQRHKNNGYRPTVSELEGHIVEFACDSHGSRLIQYLMENVSDEEKQALVDEALEDALHLMTDTFGNYVMQNFLIHSTESQRLAILNKMKGSVLHLSKQAHGCRVVQKAIEVAPVEQRNWFIYELCVSEEMIRACARDPHATHCLQKSISVLQMNRNGHKQANEEDANREQAKLLTKIESAIAADVVELAKHPHASRLVLLLLGDCDASRSEPVADILSRVQNAFPSLMWDQHGNFCLQHFLDYGSNEQAERVQSLVRDQVIQLAKHKFGSHLVEKCLTMASQSQVDAIVEKMLDADGSLASALGLTPGADSDGTVILSLMKDPYANFVVQRAFEFSRGQLRDELVRQIHARSRTLSKFTYGRHILATVSKATS